MKVHCLTVHPNTNSLNGGLFETSIQTFKSLGFDVTSQNVYSIKNELLSTADNLYFKFNQKYIDNWYYKELRDSCIHPIIKQEISKVKKSDILFIQTPIWLHMIPSWLKLYIEQIFVHDEFYTLGASSNDRSANKKEMRNKRCMFSCTFGNDSVKVGGAAQGVDSIINPLKHIIEFSGFNFEKPYILFNVASSTDFRAEYHESLRSYILNNSNN
jgi:NAD(P)H dehydrogenase (quinone)